MPIRLFLYDVSPARRVRWRRFPALERVPAGSNSVFLTFDDGPDESTLEVLDRLGQANLVATFFVVGEQLQRFPEVGRAIARAGHEIALHGFRHLRHQDTPPGRSYRDMEQGLLEIEAVTGTRPRWYRPPFTKFAREAFTACQALRLTPVYWSARGHDWEPVSEQHIRDAVGRNLHDGTIVLLHDSARYAQRDTVAATVAAIPLIAQDLKEMGLASRRLSDAGATLRPATEACR